MSGITTHVLDTSRGRPAQGVPVTLEIEAAGGWELVGKGTTNADGRIVFQLKSAGKYLFHGTDLHRSSKPDLEWESDFTTLVIQVR